jgi:hypothetical protein
MAHTRAPLQIATLELTRSRADARVRLTSSGNGWSLMTSSGELLFHAPGIRGRRACLEFARARGVLAVFS